MQLQAFLDLSQPSHIERNAIQQKVTENQVLIFNYIQLKENNRESSNSTTLPKNFLSFSP